MLTKIKQFFVDNFTELSSGEDTTEQQLRLATAALLIEMMLLDDQALNIEKQTILALLQQQFSLTEDEARKLYALAEDEMQGATDYFQFTRMIAEQFTQTEKIRLIENLWRVAFVDQCLDKYEESMVRKIADLIYVSHSDFIKAKFRAQESLQPH